jgi:hypothetical protein
MSANKAARKSPILQHFGVDSQNLGVGGLTPLGVRVPPPASPKLCLQILRPVTLGRGQAVMIARDKRHGGGAERRSPRAVEGYRAARLGRLIRCRLTRGQGSGDMPAQRRPGGRQRNARHRPPPRRRSRLHRHHRGALASRPAPTAETRRLGDCPADRRTSSDPPTSDLPARAPG